MKSWSLITVLIVWSCLANVLAKPYISIDEYAQGIGGMNPETHRICALNCNGSAMCFTTELTEAFLEQCRSPSSLRVLEVGCAYGIKSSQIVQTGVFLVANDLDLGHLEKMEEAFSKWSQEDSDFNNVEYLPGNFADLPLSAVGEERFDAILCESVLHFMYPDEVARTLGLFYAALRPGGRVYITNLSPYVLYPETFRENKARGMEWPGVFKDPKGICPVIYNIMDKEVLARELQRAGFHLVEMQYIQKPYPADPMQSSPPDWVTAIAEKN
ncbi:MAG: hypothetical protein S4CHLAM102_09040 [Chlamydiia bacterium]|nr:hypothetical protein [Chlamydiia bacterium]